MSATGNDQQGRRSRLRATSTGKRVSATDRDRLWFEKLREHGPLPSSFLLAYCGNMRASEKRGRERLTDLFNEDSTPDDGPYLIRPPQQFATIDSRYNQLVYNLALAARRALARCGSPTVLKRRHAGPWLHSHMVACVTASIELAALAKPDINYIPQSAILGRAQTELRHPTRFVDPGTKRETEKDLLPDALFGLEYLTEAGSRFRFFAVECDRSTEPATSANFNRKSAARSLLQYEAYVARGAYRDHLSLTAPLLVLNVTNDSKRMKQLLALVGRLHPDGNNYMLFQKFDEFGPAFRPPQPKSDLLSEGWRRAGSSELFINKP